MDQYEAADKPIGHVISDATKTPVFSLPELLDMVRDMGRKGLTVQRYKGLGEMNPDQLFDTTMDPETRKLLRVSLDDRVSSDQIFNILMGSEVEPRKQFIYDNALSAKDLDV